MWLQAWDKGSRRRRAPVDFSASSGCPAARRAHGGAGDTSDSHLRPGDGTPGGEALTEPLSLLARSLRPVLAAREELGRASREPLTAAVLVIVVARTAPARRSVSGHAPRHPGPQHLALAAVLAEARRLLPYPARRGAHGWGGARTGLGRGVGQAGRPDMALRAVRPSFLSAGLIVPKATRAYGSQRLGCLG